jgi:LPXTG-site transpeptidase (sortase) family protein
MKQAAAMVVIVAAASLFLHTFVNASLYAPQDSAPVGQTLVQEMAGVADAFAGNGNDASSGSHAAAKAVPKPIPSNYPVHLEIPAIYVDANIQQTTINAKGAMGVPTNFTDVAWYVNGPIPGDTGTAVIDGHYDNGLGLDGVFKHLGEIEIGNDVYVVRKDGQKLHYRVTNIEQIPYDDPTTAQKVFDPQTYQSEIKLVTCSGTWVPNDRTYNQRVVVTAALVQ